MTSDEQPQIDTVLGRLPEPLADTGLASLIIQKGESPSAGELPAEKLGGFLLVHRLGRGGMGDVYLAIQETLDRHVAIKTLRPEDTNNLDFIARFQKEAKAMARVDHPHIVKCYSIGLDEPTGLHYVVMEYVDGSSLERFARQHRTLQVADAVCVGLAVAQALEHAHARGLIHRDIKPDNILITREGVVKVSDLGLAKALDEEYSTTKTGIGMGTPYYMAPEQARSAKHVDHRADMHALGCTLYRLLAGELPFAGNDFVAIVSAKEKGQYKPLRRIVPAVPEHLEWIIDRLLAAKPESRYATWPEVVRDLKALHLASEKFGTTSTAPLDTTAPPSRFTSRGDQESTSFAQPAASERVSSSLSYSSPSNSGLAQKSSFQVCYQDPTGKPVLKKMTEGEIRRAVSTGLFDLTAEVKPEDGQAFEPLAKSRQFHSLVKQVSAIRSAEVHLKVKSKQTEKRVARDRRGQFFEQGWFLGLMLALLVGLVTWSLWPLSETQLLARGRSKFASDELSDRLQAREEYLEPLLRRFPESSSAKTAREMILELEAQLAARRIESKVRRNRPAEHEAERLAMKAYQLEQFGDVASATESYRAIAQLFEADPQAQDVVALARYRIQKAEQTPVQASGRNDFLTKLLIKADLEEKTGQTISARDTWTNLITLYAETTEAQPFVAYAQARLEGRDPEPVSTFEQEARAEPITESEPPAEARSVSDPSVP